MRRYRQRECIFECMSEAHFNICECMELNSFLYVDAKLASEAVFCNPRKAIECAKQNHNASVINALTQKCFSLDVCPESCEFWRYTASLSSSPIVWNVLETPLQEYRNSTQMAINSATLAIFYGDVQYSFIQEYPSQTPVSLISSIGGLFGLWLGCSAMSFVHLIYFVCRWTYGMLKSRGGAVSTIQSAWPNTNGNVASRDRY